MRRFVASLIILFAVLSGAWPQSELKTFRLVLPKEGTFAYSVQKPLDQKEPIPVESQTTEIAAPDDPNGHTVFVINTETNRAAAKSLVEILKSGSWNPKDAEFTRVGGIEIELKPESGVVTAASLKILSGERGEDRLITARSENRALFRYLLSPDVEIQLDYESESGPKTMELRIKIPESSYPNRITMEIPESYASPESAASAPSGEPETGGGTKSPLVGFGQILVGLLIVGGLAYGAYWYYRNNQKVVEGWAKNAGIAPSTDSDPTGAHPDEPEPRKIEKIDLGASAAPTAAATVSPTAPVRNPRLVGSNGEVFLLPEGETTIGREGSLAIPGESSVSRQHARIERAGDAITVEDMGSTNGTFLNGVKLDAPRVLAVGDVVQFGAAQFRYEE